MSALDETTTGVAGEHFVQSLERGLAVIRAFTAEAPELTLAEVARRTGLSRAAARRFLLTLVDLQYVRNDGGRYSLTPRVLELGYAYVASLSLPEVAEPHLERLAAETGEFPALSVLDGHDIVCVARVPVLRLMTVAINVGTRLPAYATATGRVLLSALGDEELERYLAKAELRPARRGHDHRPRRPARTSSACARRATRSSTRSSSAACARSPRRSAAAAGR